LPDAGVIQQLVALSVKTLAVSSYSADQIDAALVGAWGVDTQLIRDGTFFVAERAGDLVGCGGWSWRRTLFGSDVESSRDSRPLDPETDAARIRAFFVHPDHARRGVSSTILERCEIDAKAHGFRRFELMATLPGLRFYSAHGYRAGPPIEWDLGNGLTIEFVPMTKRELDD